ncbi:MAG TPA: rod shape-determining protein MreD [Vicinamibacterales bacterium]|nr:rod shape-determining protein MreD [Vicinamibacterales bacterium]
MKVAWVLLATAAAVALQTTLDRWFASGAVDLVLVVVVYNALASGRTTGMFTGSFAGLVQDALSGDVIGMAGLSKTVVGFLAGIVGTQFIVAHSASRFVVFFLATVVNAVVFMGLHELLDLRHFGLPVGAVAVQGVGNAVVGVLAFKVIELTPGAMERRRMARSGLRR